MRASQRHSGPGGGPTAGTVGLVGRHNELRLLHQAVRMRRPVLLLGPPGVSKTTMLRALAGPHAPGQDPVHWVTGDEQLSAHVLVGTFDPALVLREGYREEHFTPGPLVAAMRDGGILYIEELNRAPSGALNALITALSERYVDVAHLGRVHAGPGFMVVGSANPLDDVGTGRLSRGLLDRFLVLEVGYQPRAEEIEITRREAPTAGERLAAFAVDLTRRTREHPDLRHGGSIRAAIDLAALLAGQADALREESSPVLLRCLVCAAFTGRVRLPPTRDRMRPGLGLAEHRGHERPGQPHPLRHRRDRHALRNCRLAHQVTSLPGPPGPDGHRERQRAQDGCTLDSAPDVKSRTSP